MSACKHCNFRNTDKCVVNQIWNKFEEGEITEEEANDQASLAIMDCEEKYYDYQLDQGDIANDR